MVLHTVAAALCGLSQLSLARMEFEIFWYVLDGFVCDSRRRGLVLITLSNPFKSVLSNILASVDRKLTSISLYSYRQQGLSPQCLFELETFVCNYVFWSIKA